MDMILSQASTLLNGVVSQMTGQTNPAAINNVDQFVSVADSVLKTGLDPVINAISQVWRRTIFADRAYDNPLSSLRMSESRWGNATRKLSPIADDMEDDAGLKYPVAYDSTQNDPYGDGQSVDMYAINKQKAFQTNFYGSSVYQQHYTIFKDQFDVAFSSPEEFVRFNSMCLTERNNDRASFEEAKARLLQANMIASVIDENKAERIINLLTEYNTLTGQSLTATSVMQAGNFEAFTRWMYSRIRTLIGLMRSRSNMFQTVVTGKNILRHTNPENVRVALYRPFMEMIQTMVLSGLYHEDMMNMPTYEAIDFWQSIKSPQAINIVPTYMGTNGQPKTAANAVADSTVIGVIHDRDALGYAMLNAESSVTPYNSRGRYWNDFYNARCSTMFDNSEKIIVLKLA